MYITGTNLCEHDFMECTLGVVEFNRYLPNSVQLPLLLLHEWDVYGLIGERSFVIDANVVVYDFVRHDAYCVEHKLVPNPAHWLKHMCQS